MSSAVTTAPGRATARRSEGFFYLKSLTWQQRSYILSVFYSGALGTLLCLWLTIQNGLSGVGWSRIVIALGLHTLVVSFPHVMTSRGRQPVHFQFSEFSCFVAVALLPDYLMPLVLLVAELPMWLVRLVRWPKDRFRWVFNTGCAMLTNVTIVLITSSGAPLWSFALAAAVSGVGGELLVCYVITLFGGPSIRTALKSNWNTRLGLPVVTALVVSLAVSQIRNVTVLAAILPLVLMLTLGSIALWVRQTVDHQIVEGMEQYTSILSGKLDPKALLMSALDGINDLLPLSMAEITLYDETRTHAVSTMRHEPPLHAATGESRFTETDGGEFYAEGKSTDSEVVYMLSSVTGVYGHMRLVFDAARRGRRPKTELVTAFGTSLANNLAVALMYQEQVHNATHDKLTGLGNRTRLYDNGDTLIAGAAAAGTRAALLLLDLDGFKNVNDTLGHDAGDSVLVETSQRLKSVLGDDDIVVRLGGDEFAILVQNLRTEDDAFALAGQITTAVTPTIVVGEFKIVVDTSIGIALAGEDGDTVGELLKSADVAVYQAKARGFGHAVRYNADMKRHTSADLALHSDLREALSSGEGLVMHYQPQVSVLTGQTSGMEALVRWQHPTLGMLYPDSFIYVAEQSGMLRQFTLAVFDQALQDYAVLRTLADHPMTISVNTSAQNLIDQGFPADVERLLTKHGVPAEELVVEVTETARPSDSHAAARVLEALSQLGCEISIDDFGKGYSSIASLSRGRFREVKIEKEFVRNMIAQPDFQATVKGVIDIAHGHTCRVVAEGVEDDALVKMLTDFGCDTMQGFGICRPAGFDAIVTWLTARGTDWTNDQTSLASMLRALPDADTSEYAA